MTIGWGSVGYYWRRPVFTCVVRQSRFTDQQLKENPVFTVSVPKDSGLDKALPSAAASRAVMKMCIRDSLICAFIGIVRINYGI